MKVAVVICQYFFCILALVIFLLKVLLNRVFFGFGVEIRF